MSGALAAASISASSPRRRSIRGPSESPKTSRRMTSSVIACIRGRSANGRPAGQRSTSARAIAAISSR
jgi:hypothetical protein